MCLYMGVKNNSTVYDAEKKQLIENKLVIKESNISSGDRLFATDKLIHALLTFRFFPHIYKR